MSPPLGTARTLSYASGSVAVDAVTPILAWLPYLYAPPADAPGATIYLSAATVGACLFVGRFVDGFAEPVVGYLSDGARTRFGRRIPFIVLGTPVLALALLALFFPPFGAERPVATGVFLTVTNTIFWCAYTAVVAPYLALLPEIAHTTEERTRVSSYMTGFSVLVIILGNVVLGRAVAAFHGGGEWMGLRFSNGFEPQAIACALVMVVFFLLSIAFVRERPARENPNGQLSLREAVLESLRNPAFLPLVLPLAVLLVGVNLLVTAVPYFGRALLGATESEASLGTAAVYLSAALSLPLLGRAVAHLGKRRAYSIALLALAVLFSALPAILLFSQRTVAYLVLMALIGVPVGAMLVLSRVLISDVIDADEARTGLRREAMYFGMQGLLTKVSFGVGPLIATQLFSWFGNTAERPLGILLCGPAAGVLAFAGWRAFRRYPLG